LRLGETNERGKPNLAKDAIYTHRGGSKPDHQ
jgi:hypothetical protein